MISDRMADILRRLPRGDEGLTEECARLLRSDAVAATLILDGDPPETVWCSAGLGVLFEEAQATLGEGPGQDAARTGRSVLEPDLAAVRPERWPALLPTAAHLGVAAVYCFPLGIGAISVGALTVLQSSVRRLSDQELDDAALLADALTMQFLGRGGEESRLDAWIGTESPGVLRRSVVHQATGMVSVQLGRPLGQALLRLRAHAYSAEQPLGDVAADVVARRLSFTDDPGGPRPPEAARG